MKKIYTLLMIACMLAPVLLTAKPIRVEGWHHYKEIIWSAKKKNAPSVGIFELDEQVSKKRGRNDLRVMMGDRQLPYFTRYARSERSQASSLPLDIIYENVKKRKKTILIKLPELAKNEKFQTLKFRVPYSYEGSVSLSYGKTPESVRNSRYQRLFSYSNGDKQKSLLLPNLKEAKYLRLTYDFRSKLAPISISKMVGSQSLDYELTAEGGQFSVENADNNQQVITIKNTNNHPVYRIEMIFKENRFSRKIHVSRFIKSSRKFRTQYTGLIESSGEADSMQMIQLNRTVFGAVKVTIDNKDDEPLHLKSIKVFAPKEELLVSLPDAGTTQANVLKQPLRLYYGNEYAPNPRYDFTSIYKKTPRSKMQKLSLGTEIENPEFGYSLIEPPISIYFIRFLFLLGVVLVGIPAYKTFKNLKTLKDVDDK